MRLSFLIALSLLSFGCSKSEEDSVTTAEAPPRTRSGPQPEMGMTFMNLSNPFFTSIRDVVSGMASHEGIKVIINGADMDASRQLDIMQNYAQQKVDCILLNPVDSDAVSAGVKAANEAKIPIVTFDVNASGGEVACFVESNNVLAGQLCADQRLKGKAFDSAQAKGKVIILDHPTVTSVQQRVAGFEEILKKKYPNIRIVTKQEGGATVEPARRAMESLLTGYPDIDAVFAINDPTAAQALEAAKRKDIFVSESWRTIEIRAERRKVRGDMRGSTATFRHCCK